MNKKINEQISDNGFEIGQISPCCQNDTVTLHTVLQCYNINLTIIHDNGNVVK